MGGAARPRPRVEAVLATLRAWIESGRLRRGRQLPPEPELAAELRVSRATLREALRSLEDEGVLTRTRGAGTFLATGHRLRNNLDANFGVTEAIRQAGMRPGFEEATVRCGRAGPEEAERLELEPEDEVVMVERVRTADGRRVVHSVDILPGWMVEDRPALRRRLARGSLYELLEKDLGVAIHHGVASFTPARASRAIAAKLRVSRGALILYLHQVDYDEAGRPVMSSHEHHLADAFEFMVVRRGPGRRFG